MGASKKTPEVGGPALHFLKLSFEFFNHVISLQKSVGSKQWTAVAVSSSAVAKTLTLSFRAFTAVRLPHNGR